MQLDFAIQPVMHGPGYEVVRVADNAVLTTVPTAGEASQYIHELELARRYDAERSGELYVRPEPTDDIPTLLTQCRASDMSDASINALIDASAPAIFARWAEEDEEDDGDDAEEDDAESVPVPPVPAGYPSDKALMYKWYGDTFITIDRRDGEMAICDRAEMGATILTPAFAAALYQFFWNDAVIELMEFHRKQAA